MTPTERAARIQRQVDRLIERGNLRGVAQRRREDPDGDEAMSRFDGDENQRAVLIRCLICEAAVRAPGICKDCRRKGRAD